MVLKWFPGMVKVTHPMTLIKRRGSPSVVTNAQKCLSIDERHWELTSIMPSIKFHDIAVSRMTGGLKKRCYYEAKTETGSWVIMVTVLTADFSDKSENGRESFGLH